MTLWDAPNQQVVGLDPPWVEGTGGPAGPQGDLMSMTKAELLEHAEATGADVNDSMTKAEIVEAMGAGA